MIKPLLLCFSLALVFSAQESHGANESSGEHMGDEVAHGDPFHAPDSLSVMEDRLQFWYGIAPWCEGFPAKEHCDDGDATLFNGLLCSADAEDGCTAVRDAQGPDGRWWRSPRRVGLEEPGGVSFSRDMAMGVLLYLAASGDQTAAIRWLNWIDDNRPCLLTNPVTGRCSVWGVHRYCRDDSDNRCSITPNMWSLMGVVWDWLGLERHSQMNLFAGSHAGTAVAESRNAPLGYELHLKGVQAFLNRLIGRNGDVATQVAGIVRDRQPLNPFFMYLADPAGTDWQERFMAVCPNLEDDSGFAKRQWSWERDTSSEAWRESMVWDCIFLGKLAQKALQASL